VATGHFKPDAIGNKRAAISGMVLLCVALVGCAQTNTLFDGTTGSLAPASQRADAQAGSGQPPLPGRRDAKSASDSAQGGLLAAISDIELSAPSVAPRSVTADDTTVNVYVRLARQIRRCWLGPRDPRLPGHGFRAQAEPGDASEAEIDVYKEVPGRKYGPYVFEVKITPQGSGALVRSTNRRLEDELANMLRGDIARWVGGGAGCADGSGKSA